MVKPYQWNISKRKFIFILTIYIYLQNRKLTSHLHLCRSSRRKQISKYFSNFVCLLFVTNITVHVEPSIKTKKMKVSEVHISRLNGFPSIKRYTWETLGSFLLLCFLESLKAKCKYFVIFLFIHIYQCCVQSVCPATIILTNSFEQHLLSGGRGRLGGNLTM